MAESVQSVGRALDLIERLSDADAEVGLTELARRAGLQPPTAHRLLQTLVARGWVVQNPATSRYRLSHRLLAVAGGIEAQTARVRAAARPHLERLRDLSGESTNLVVLDGLSVVYLDQAPSLRPMRMFTAIGARVPAYASAAGKAMLAFASPGAIVALNRVSLEPLTEHTLTDHAALKRELRRARTRGYAFDNEEYELGVACAAAPILDLDGTAFAALSVSAPATRWRTLDRATLGRQLAEHGREISSELGYVDGVADGTAGSRVGGGPPAARASR